MKILTVIDTLKRGGRQRAAQDYALGYLRAGHGSAVLAVTGGGPRAQVLRQREVPVFIGGDDEAARAEAIRAAQAWQPDAVHLHSFGPPLPVMAEAIAHLKAALPAAPVLETTSFGKVDYRQRYTLTDVHLLMTRWAFWRWQKWTRSLRLPPLGVVAPITADPTSFYPVTAAERAAFRRTHGVPDDAFLFGRVGQPSVWKWDPVIFPAFARVARRYPQSYLFLVGLPPELRPDLDALDASVRERIIEVPLLDGDAALRACYGALDVFLHAARIGESFGLVLTEAMLCECPVVTLSTPARDNSQLEVVGHLRGGLVVNGEDGMVAAMTQLLRDEPLRRRLAEQGAEHVRSTLTLDHVVPALLRIIEMARAAPSRDALARALRAAPDLVTHVSDAEIVRRLHDTLDRVPRSHELMMQLIHVPLVARLVWGAKARLNRLRRGNA
ncbi:MAG: glycosyltransferase family 4 protein [Bacteroidota bacterium]